MPYETKRSGGLISSAIQGTKKLLGLPFRAVSVMMEVPFSRAVRGQPLKKGAVWSATATLLAVTFVVIAGLVGTAALAPIAIIAGTTGLAGATLGALEKRASGRNSGSRAMSPSRSARATARSMSREMGRSAERSNHGRGSSRSGMGVRSMLSRGHQQSRTPIPPDVKAQSAAAQAARTTPSVSAALPGAGSDGTVGTSI